MSTASNLVQPKHPYPLAIGVRTQRLIQGSIFYDVFVDTATALYVKAVPDGEGSIKKSLMRDGWREDTYETSWSCFVEYLTEFPDPSHQNAVFSIISHWDWYVSSLGRFIDFGNAHLFAEGQRRNLRQLSLRPFREQVTAIEKATSIDFSAHGEAIALVHEMHLVRNIGMHNEWRVDTAYLKYTKTPNLAIGQKRLPSIDELGKWHTGFVGLINFLSLQVAIRYARVPTYE